jgi:hypothetical protein
MTFNKENDIKNIAKNFIVLRESKCQWLILTVLRQ